MAEEAPAGLPAIKPRVIGRYALFGEIAAGGMATVHFGRLVGPVGFSRTVAIKRLHPQYAKDPEFVAMFLDEARLASRVQHPNVVTTLDVVNMPSEVFLVMEFVLGESLSRLVRNAKKQNESMPPGHVVAVMSGMLHGLHAAHEAKSEKREPLNIVHRDISPQNVLVGVDGVARVLDFGVAKAALRSGSTRDGQMKGKLSYMSPEQLNGKAVDRRTDIFAAGVVLWEALAGRRLFDGADAGEIFAKVLAGDIPDPRTVAQGVSDAMAKVVMKGLERNPDNRYQTAREFAIELESSMPPSTGRTVGEWVERVAGPDLERRRTHVAEVESVSTSPEDLARMEAEEGVEPLEIAPERQSVSAVKSVSGSRPRITPPAPAVPRAAADAEERSVTTGSSTSQVSSLVVPQQPVPSTPARPKSRTGVWFGAVSASAVGGVLAFYLFAQQQPPGGTASAPAAGGDPRPAVATAPAAVAPAAPAAPAETVDIEDLPPSTTPFEGGDVADDGITIETVEKSGEKPSVKRKAVKAGPPKPNCNPPFTFDAQGIKRLKPGCL